MASSGRRLGIGVIAAPPDTKGLSGPEARHGRSPGSPISLQYPNGRVHETTLPTSGELKPGHRFELFGRHWNAVSLLEPSRWKVDEQPRMLCLSTNGPDVPT